MTWCYFNDLTLHGVVSMVRSGVVLFQWCDVKWCCFNGVT